MLFGMCQAPFKFTAICKPISRLFGALRIAVLNYIDDWYWPTRKADGDALLAFIKRLFIMLGWTFNDKSQRGTRVQLLGFVLDLVRRCFVVPHEKRVTLLSIMQEFKLASEGGDTIGVLPLQSAMGQALSMTLAIPGIKVWCRSLYTQVVIAKKGQVSLTATSLEELRNLVVLLELTEGAPFVSKTHDCEVWVDSGEVGWGAHYEGQEVSGQFDEIWVGQSSTARELQGLIHVIQALGPGMSGRVVRLNMDSMCSVRNILKGGGPVPLLCSLVKQLWQLCDTLAIQMVPRWQRRSVTMMQRADVLSKVGTEWVLRADFLANTMRAHGLPVELPDLARAEPTIAALIKRRKSGVLLLPRWEGKAWWQLVLNHATISHIDRTAMPMTVHPNMYGWPRWDFVVAVFRF